MSSWCRPGDDPPGPPGARLERPVPGREVVNSESPSRESSHPDGAAVAASVVGRTLRGLAICFLLMSCLPGPARAQVDHVLRPRGPDDWHVVRQTGGATWSVEIRPTPDLTDSMWVFHLDAPEGNTHSRVVLELPLSEQGIPPQPPDQAYLWVWRWFVKNRETADYVALRIVDEEDRNQTIAVSHVIYDYEMDVFAPPDHFMAAHFLLSESGLFRGERDREPEALGRIVAFRIEFRDPHEQEVWVGPVWFGPRPENPPAPSPRAERSHLEEGLFLVADLDGDAVPEVITPWAPGRKVWAFEPRARRFLRENRDDALGRAEPYHLLAPLDLDGDGDLDLVALDPDDETFEALIHRRGGYHSVSARFPLPEPTAMATCLALAGADAGHLPAVFVGYQLMKSLERGRVFRIPVNGSGEFLPPGNLPTTVGPGRQGVYFVQVQDLDGDKVADLATGSGGTGVRVYRGAVDGSFGPVREIDRLSGRGFFRNLAVGDVDGDGDLDLLATCQWSNESDAGAIRLLLNEGGLRFRDATDACRVPQIPGIQEARFVELDGRPGPELALLEDGGIRIYAVPDSGALRELGRTTDEAATGARRFAVADLDGDGVPEAIISHEDGPDVVALPVTGPVSRIVLRGQGPNSGSVGGVLEGVGSRRWSLPVTATERGGAIPFLAAPGDSVRLRVGHRVGRIHVVPPAGGVLVLEPPALESLGPAGRTRFWLRWKGPTLWEYPVAAIRTGEVQAGLGLLLAVGLGASMWRARSRRRTARSRAWRELLSRLGFSNHAAWRQSLAHLLRAANQVKQEGGGGPEDLERLRGLMPEEVRKLIREGVEAAWTLELEGARTAERALDELDRLLRADRPDLERLVNAAHDLESSLKLLQRPLARRFLCDAREVYERVRRFRVGEAGMESVTWSGGPEELARRFPMAAEDLFGCLDELIRNALKKEPRPGRVEVTVREQGPKVTVLEVHDDGAGLEREWRRDERPGSRSGLTRLNQVLAPYGGRVDLDDAEEGGVTARLRVPRFDLD